MKLIELPHKVCGMTCMVNGLEDLYEWKTGERLPDWLLFYMSGLGAGFTYLKNGKAPAPRMVMWGTTTQRQYEALAEVVGFTWDVIEGRSFEFTFKRARGWIDVGTPVVLGALDMYHLPYYEKFYHTFHIPIHYVLMVGYDDARQVVLVQDCDRAEVQAVPYDDLRLAWDVRLPGLSDRNTMFTFAFSEQVAGAETITREGLRKRAAFMLDPPAGMFGIKGMRKLARELPHWSGELTVEQWDASLRHLVEYTGFPPMLPNRLTGYDAPDNHAAGRDGFADLLTRLGGEYGEPAWIEVAALFAQSGQLIRQLTDTVVEHILGEGDTLAAATALLVRIGNLEEQAYHSVVRSA